LIVDYGIKNNTKTFLNSFEFLLFILAFINLITILLHPDGLYVNSTGYYSNWFLGYKNTHILFLMPLTLISLSNSYLKFNRLKFRNYIVILLSIVSTVLVENSTGLVGLLIIISFITLPKKIKDFKIFNIMNYFMVYISSFIFIVVLRLQNYFSFFIVDFLHKDLTFTGRTYIWDSVIETIKYKLILGHGLVTFHYMANVYTTHNSLLDLLYKTGIIGFVSYIIIIYKSLKELYKYRDYKIAKFISIVLFTYFIMMLTEAYPYDFIIFILISVYLCFLIRI
jgi:O-antigen ligase